MIAYWKIRARLLDVPGVANAPIWGERIKMPQVQVDTERMRAYDVSLDEVMETTCGCVGYWVVAFLEWCGHRHRWIYRYAQSAYVGIRSVLPIITPEKLAQVPITGRWKSDGTRIAFG